MRSTGSAVFYSWAGGVFPTIRLLGIQDGRRMIQAVMKHSHYLFTLTGAGVILTGILLGTWLGPVKNMEALWHTTYGNLWFTALIIGIITLLWGTFIGYPYAIKVLSNNHIWERAAAGNIFPLSKAFFKLILVESVEGIGFVVLLALMIML